MSISPPAQAKLVIIGGGLSGLSAAVYALLRGVKPVIIEAAPHLGGRTKGISAPWGRVDNGQHLLLGAYSELLSLLDLVNSSWQKSVYRAPLKLCKINNHTAFTLNNQYANNYLNFLTSVYSNKQLTWRDKLSLCKFACFTKFKNSNNVAAYLASLKITANLRNNFFNPLCSAALTTTPQDACIEVFNNVLLDSFTANADLIIPKTDLSTLIIEPLQNFIRQQQGEIYTHTRALALQISDSAMLINTNKGMINAEKVIIATAPQHTARLLNGTKVAALLNKLEYNAITTYYLKFAEQMSVNFPMLQIEHDYFEWLFQHQLDSSVLAFVASAKTLPVKSELESHLELYLKRYLTLPNIIGRKMVHDKYAALKCSAQVQQVRAQLPSILNKNLALAGDYMFTRYPSCMEGAVRSALQAVKALCS